MAANLLRRSDRLGRTHALSCLCAAEQPAHPLPNEHFEDLEQRVANGRTPAEIQAEIEQARGQLASSLDQLAERTSPKRLAEQTKQSLLAKATSPQGKKAIGATVAAVTALIIISRRRKRSAS
jgi:predicted metalloprotease with PDZ domain